MYDSNIDSKRENITGAELQELINKSTKKGKKPSSIIISTKRIEINDSSTPIDLKLGAIKFEGCHIIISGDVSGSVFVNSREMTTSTDANFLYFEDCLIEYESHIKNFVDNSIHRVNVSNSWVILFTENCLVPLEYKSDVSFNNCVIQKYRYDYDGVTLNLPNIVLTGAGTIIKSLSDNNVISNTIICKSLENIIIKTTNKFALNVDIIKHTNIKCKNKIVVNTRCIYDSYFKVKKSITLVNKNTREGELLKVTNSKFDTRKLILKDCVLNNTVC